MATIHVERAITQTPEELLSRFEKDILTHPKFKMFVDRYEIQGHRVTFEGSKGISGIVEARAGVLIVDVTLSGMAALMKTFIEGKLTEVLSRLASASNPSGT